MKACIVFAHPERRSFDGSLLDVVVKELEDNGHEVKVSDLYAMKWKTNVDVYDFPTHPVDTRLKVLDASTKGSETEGGLTKDVYDEQAKLVWADFLVLIFPFWWFTMPAILKGWVDRVFSSGFAYGVGAHSQKKWGDRYGDGILAGKRAMLITTIGSWPDSYSRRGINGYIDDLLFPINHGILFYPGYTVLPPFVVYKTDTLTSADFEKVASELRERIKTFDSTQPIPYRSQNGGDYTIPQLELKLGKEKPGTGGFDIHLK